MKHTPGSMRAARILIFGREILDTLHGAKRVADIAELIDDETAAPELLEACEEILELLEEHQPVWYLKMHYNHLIAAIKKAKGGA